MLLQKRLDEVNSAVDQRLRDATSQAYQQGGDEVRRALEERTQAELERLIMSIAEAGAVRRQALRRAQADIVRLSVEIARRILHREITVDPTALEGLVGAAAEKLGGQEVLKVRVHPDHAVIVRQAMERAGRAGGLEIVPESTLLRGATVFDLARGSLDASVDTQLREIERGLIDHLRRAG
jgi:flagellar assembly protein FliH